MIFTPEILILIQQLISTRSHSDHYKILTDFLLTHPSEIDNCRTLLDSIQGRIAKQSEQGKEAAKQRVYAKANPLPSSGNPRHYSKPMFSKDYRSKGKCVTCGEVIISNKAFRWKQVSGIYQDYHAIPTCFPPESESVFSTNKEYIKEMLPKE